MRETGVNKVVFRYCKIRVNKENISTKFQKLSNRRDIRNGTVNSLLKVLRNGKHFETPLVCNRINNTFRLLDGNHRLEAIEKYFSLFPRRKVELFVFYYEDLSEDEEKAIYTKWNLGSKQSTNDFVKQYWEDIPIAKLFEKNGFPYPVKHCWSAKAMEFKLLVGGYLSKNNEKFSGGFRSGAIKFIEEAKNLDISDYNVIKQFLKEYISVFGLPNRKNMYYKLSLFYSIIRIWLDNKDKVNPDRMHKAFVKLRGHERILYYHTVGGSREVTIQCHIDLLNVLNGKRKRGLFV